MARQYNLSTQWLVPRALTDVWQVMEYALQSDDPFGWWSAVEVVSHRGAAIDLVTRSPIGYSLHFTIADLQLTAPTSMRFTSAGDLEGDAELVFVARGEHQTELTIHWRVTATQRWMQRTEPLLRPVFRAAHWWTMRTGEQQFNRWLDARPPRHQ